VSRVFYRIIEGSEHTLRDFLPPKEVGKPLTDEAWRREWESAVSVFDDFNYIVKQLKRFPRLGAYIATVLVLEDGSVEFARTGGRHHYSIFAPEEVVLNLVTGRAIPVSTEKHHG
jgi:hypothetical protein